MGLLADLTDRTLEGTVAGSFTRIGSLARSRLDRWTPVERYDLSGRVAIVTGATSGLGLATARSLAADGATVILVVRNEAKGTRVADALRAAGAPGGVELQIADLSDLDAVRDVAASIASAHPAIDVLIHNAGALDDRYRTTAAGREVTVASQVVGPFLLTHLLVPQLRVAPHGRVIWVASGGMYTQPLDVAALEMPENAYDGTTAYARAKRAQVTLAELWADELAADSIVVHAMHPGWADTPGVEVALPTFQRIVGPLLRSPEEGADTIIWLAADDDRPLASTGRFWLDRRVRATHRLRRTRTHDTGAERRRLWAWCLDASGVSSEPPVPH